MNITKTEVLKAIADCQHATGWGPLDRSLAEGVQKGAIAVLIEAAKCARYKNTSHYTANSGADWALDADDPRKPVHHYDQGDDDE